MCTFVFWNRGVCYLEEGLWQKSLKIIALDSRIDSVIYESIISKMKLVLEDVDYVILSCRDDYSLNLVKNKNISPVISDAINMVANRNLRIDFIREGDENAFLSSSIAGKKVTEKNSSISTFPDTNLSLAYTFENFIVGNCNRFAHAAAVSVSSQPGMMSKNPLFLWGNSGLGKTHLMQAIGNKVLENFNNKKVLYSTCESFTNQYIHCINAKTDYVPFRNKFRNVDVLLIDDIQFLIGKEGVQSEFFNTFESLINGGKQIVITSDKPPKMLTELDERLTSRFQNGFTMDVQPPDFETRKAIIINKIKHDNIVISDEIIDYVCENITSNIRELNGAYNLISSYYALSNGVLDFDETKKYLSSIISPSKTRVLTADIITTVVSQYYDISIEKIKSKVRASDILIPRSIAMYLCRDLLGMQYNKIGLIFGKRDHSTVMNACNKVEKNESIQKDIEEIKKRLP